MEKRTLKEIIDEVDRDRWGHVAEETRPSTGAGHSDPTKEEIQNPDEQEISIEQLKLVKVGSIRYKVPKPPFTSPDKALAMFRAYFEGADIEIVAAICLNSQNEFLNLIPIAYGSIDHVHVTRREFFKRVLADNNSAAFIVAHNHPSGNPEPSQEDFTMLVNLRDEGVRMDCFMNDFMIIGKNGSYYSHRELHYGKSEV